MSEFEFDEPYVVIERHESSVGSFLFGVAIGAGIALLFAPHAGSEMRRTMRKHARRVTRRAQNLASEVSGTVTDSFQQARDEVEHRLDAARNAIELKRAQVSRAVEAGRQAAHDARDELERRIAETKAAYDAEPGTRRKHGVPDAEGNGDDPTV